MRSVIALVALLLPVLAFADARPGQGPDRGPVACDREHACRPSGCNGEICASDAVHTPCVVLPIHACFSLAECDCLGSHCGWRGNAEFQACLRANSDDPGRASASGSEGWTTRDGRAFTTLTFLGHPVEIELLPDGRVFIEGRAFVVLNESVASPAPAAP